MQTKDHVFLCRVQSRNKLIGGQTLLEYVLTISIIALALTAMAPYLSRGIQSIVKSAADELAPQIESEPNIDDESGYLIESITSTRADMETQIIEQIDTKRYDYADEITTGYTSAVNMGYTEVLD